MSNVEEIEIKNIDHLGIVAGIIDSIGLVETINSLIGQESGEKISPGHVVKAMILNGLGFVSSPLYMFSDFFQDKPCEYLIGEGVKAEYLNDDKLGRVMDKLFIKGLTEIFLAISINVFKQFNISLETSHLDSSSLHLHGEYQASLPDVILTNNLSEGQIKSPKPIEITYGYSRDHRPDLKQFIIELISSGDGDIPIFFDTASGNQSDSSSFAQIFISYKEQIKSEDDDSLMVADAALYNAKNISLLSGMKWLSRVPLTIGMAKDKVSTLLSPDFINSSLPGYSYAEIKSNYGGVEQRWLVVESSERKESDLRKLEKRISKSKVSALDKLKKLLDGKFKSYEEAVKAVDVFNKKLKYNQLDNINYLEKQSKDKKDIFYQVNATLSEDINAIKIAYRSAGRFVLATNILDEKSLSNDDMISKYKGQQSCERGFGFLKDPLFFADSIFLKSPERIQAMAMIMGLCLLVYTLAQRQIRKALSASNSTIKNQLGRAINNPTMRLIFQRFQSIHLVQLHDDFSISNLTSEREYILSFLPENCRYYYKC